MDKNKNPPRGQEGKKEKEKGEEESNELEKNHCDQ
jgi:hypothetical protein